METETLAEVLCNLNGADPNLDTDWRDALIEARRLQDAVQRGEMHPWWTDESR